MLYNTVLLCMIYEFFQINIYLSLSIALIDPISYRVSQSKEKTTFKKFKNLQIVN